MPDSARGLVMRISGCFSVTLLCGMSLAILPVVLPAQLIPTKTLHSPDADAVRELEHQSPDWKAIEKHLPDPATSSASVLELQGDVLRARRFPEDALDFYVYALQRGADPRAIYKKMGITHLELHDVDIARAYFQKCVKIDRNDASAWNDLAAVEYLNREYSASIRDYKRSLKLDKYSAIYHSNLGMAYFDSKNFNNARKELAAALKLDPEVFHKASSSGIAAHVVSPEDRALFCMEMAKTYAIAGNETEMMHSLSMASEAGANLIVEMSKDKDLARYKDDPRVLVLVQNAKALRAGGTGLAQLGTAPTIPSYEAP
jgi:tetratricopeptide (TPR) repeat protein